MNRHLFCPFISRLSQQHASDLSAEALAKAESWHPCLDTGVRRYAIAADSAAPPPSLRGATRRGNPDDGSFGRGLHQSGTPHGLPRHLTVPRNDGGGYGQAQRGSALLAIYLALAAVAVIGVVSVNIMKGPVRTMNTVTQRTLAQNDMIAAQRLAVIAALQQDGGIDCDEDGRVEPLAWAGSNPALGGGTLPPSVGAPRKDPWGTEYGYCVWDHGTQIKTTCTNAANRLRGANGDLSGMAVAMISAGADKVFQTFCADAPNYLNRGTGSDDIVSTHTYAEVAAITGGDTAIAVAGGDNLGNHTASQTLNMGGYIVTGLASPLADTDATSKKYVDEIVLASGGGGSNSGIGTYQIECVASSSAFNDYYKFPTVMCLRLNSVTGVTECKYQMLPISNAYNNRQEEAAKSGWRQCPVPNNITNSKVTNPADIPDLPSSAQTPW